MDWKNDVRSDEINVSILNSNVMLQRVYKNVSLMNNSIRFSGLRRT